MEKATKIINSWWFRSALCGATALLLTFTGKWLLVGIPIGIGIRELLLALKPKSKKCEDKCEKCSPDCECVN